MVDLRATNMIGRLRGKQKSIQNNYFTIND